MTDTTPPVDSPATQVDLALLNETVLAAFPKMSRAGAALGLTLYRQLMKGAAVRREELATAAQKPTRDVVTVLNEPGMRCQLLYDQARSIIGFAGLSIQTTRHALRFGDRSIFTWCAWDGLFIPPLLSTSADLRTTCPACKSRLDVSVAPTGATAREGGDPVMSYSDPDANCCQVTEDSISAFCDWVNLFCSPRCAGEGLPEGRRFVLLSLRDAFELGALYNRSRFGTVMESFAGDAKAPWFI